MESKQTNINTLKAHLAINVRNVEQSIDFYRKMLGIDPSKVRPGYAKFDVQNPPLNLTLNQVPFTDRGALSHLGIQVASTDAVLAQRDRWIDAGLITRDEMQTTCCYAKQDKTWVHDPDGNEWEVFVVLEDNLPETSTCCVPAEVSSDSTVATPVKVEQQGSCGCAVPTTINVAPSPCCSPN